MSEYPPDVLKAAEAALDNILCSSKESCGSDAAVRQAAIEEISRAILDGGAAEILFLKEKNKRLTVEASRYAHDAEAFRRERNVAEDRASKLAKALAISLHVMRSYKAMGYGDEVHMSALRDAIQRGEDAYIQEITDTKTGEKFQLGGSASKARAYSHPAPGDRGGGKSENNEGDTLEGSVIRDDDENRGSAES